MSTNNISSTESYLPSNIVLAQSLSDTEQTTISHLLTLLPNHCIAEILIENADDSSGEGHNESAKQNTALFIKKMVDGRGLACPMPLLKTKVALRDVTLGESIYVIATDPNSKADITAFCRQTEPLNTANTLRLSLNQTTTNSANDSTSTASLDTIFHFIITKTDSN